MGFGMEAIMVLLLNSGIWGGLRGIVFVERREMRCGFLKFGFSFRGLVETIRLDEDFEVFLKVETELWSSV